MPFEEKTLRSFLCASPKPVRIVVHVENEDAREIQVTHGRNWAHIAASICAVSATLVECFGKDGELLRARRANEEEEIQKQTNLAIGVPITTDPETARLTHFANLLARAYEHSTNVAFSKMVELFEKSNERSANIEARLERTESAYRRTLNEQLQDAFDRAAEQAQAGEQPQNPLMQMAQAFLGGMQAGATPALPPTPPASQEKPNGRGRHPPEKS